jgi:predicted lipoprotein
MDELREAVRALSEATRSLESNMESAGEAPSRSQLQVLQQEIERVQSGLNRLQTALDAWSEETESV